MSKLLSKSGSSGCNRGLMWLTYFVLDKAYVSIQNIVFTLLMSTNKVWKRVKIVKKRLNFINVHVACAMYKERIS